MKRQLNDAQIVSIMAAYHAALAIAEMGDLAACEIPLTVTSPKAITDIDVFIMYSIASDSYNVVMQPRNRGALRQPILMHYDEMSGEHISLFDCTCAELPCKSWPISYRINAWRHMLTELALLTITPNSSFEHEH